MRPASAEKLGGDFERVAERRFDVVLHRLRGAFGVVALQRVENGPVLLNRLFAIAGLRDDEVAAPIHLRLGDVDGAPDFRQAADFGDAAVEDVVELDRSGISAAGYCEPVRRHIVLQKFAGRRREFDGRAPGALHLQGAADDIGFFQVDAVDRGDIGAGLRQDGDEAFVTDALDRFAHRCARDAEGFGDGHLVDDFPRLHLSDDNQIADLVVDLIA